MATLNRRHFLEFGAAGLALATTRPSSRAIAAARPRSAPDEDDRLVRLSGDGLGLSPAQYANLLPQLVEMNGFTPDSYSLGGVVEQLEERFAAVLGKERAIFMPTGTLANHMAVRALARGSSRVIVQQESHLYKDEGDCAQTLSNLTLIPLAPGRATFTALDFKAALDDSKSERVLSPISVVSIETPVRRRVGERFDRAAMTEITALARAEGIRLHLDGARLFLEAAYTGDTVADIARPFDTVYVSLYKYFNATSGAILAGPRDLLDGMYHGRRMFGGGLASVWPFAIVALHYLDGFDARFRRAVATAEDWIRQLGRHDAFAVERITPGTNWFRLRVKGTDPAAFRRRLASAGVMLSAPPPEQDQFLIAVNETWNRTTAAELTDRFVSALAG